jgi:hypothetical protein
MPPKKGKKPDKGAKGRITRLLGYYGKIITPENFTFKIRVCITKLLQ